MRLSRSAHCPRSVPATVWIAFGITHYKKPGLALRQPRNACLCQAYDYYSTKILFLPLNFSASVLVLFERMPIAEQLQRRFHARRGYRFTV